MNDNDDPTMSKIREQAALIKHIATNAEAYPDEAWSKSQLSSMLCEVLTAANEVISLTGIPDVERFFEDVGFRLTEERGPAFGNGLDEKYRPYSDVD